MTGTVLVAEANEESAARLESGFRELGWEVLPARSDRDARNLLSASSVDLLVAPLSDPSVDGLSLCRFLDTIEGRPRPRVILTARPGLAETWGPLAHALGAESIPSLPGGGQELRKALEMLVESDDGAVPASRPPPDLPTLLDAVSRTAAFQTEAFHLAAASGNAVVSLLEVSLAAQRRAPIQEIGDLILESAVSSTGSEAGWVLIRHDPSSEDHLTLLHPRQMDRNALQLALSLVNERLVREGPEGSDDSEMWRSLGFQRLMVFPLSQGSVGWVGVANKSLPYSPLEESFVECLSVILSIHYQQSQALYRAREAMDEAQAQFKAATLILPYEEPQVVARQVAQAVASFLGYRNCAVMLPAKDGKHLDVVGASGHMEKLKASLSLDGGGFTVKAYRMGRMVYSPNAPESPDYVPGWKDCRTELSLPLIHRNEVLGVLDVESDRERAFQGKDLRILEAFAQRVSTLIYAARQHQNLTKTKERYHKLCEGSPLGLFTWNMNTGRIEEASLVVRSWVGEETEGRLVESILEPSSRQVWTSWAAQEAHRHSPLTATLQLVATGGAPPVECTLTAYPGNGKLGIPGHAVLLARTAEPFEKPRPDAERSPAANGPVLLCDPDDVWCAVTRIMLEEWGYTVRVAENFEALAELVEGAGPAPSLLVVDQSIPASVPGRGFHALRRQYSEIPVLITGAQPPEFAESGNLKTLVKPYRMNEFRSAVEELLLRA